MLLLAACVASCLAVLTPPLNSVDGVKGILARRLPKHASSFTFEITNTTNAPYNISEAPLDTYTLSNGANGTIHISGNSGIALASGLRWYLKTYCHVDIFWFLESQLDTAPLRLPPVNSTSHGSSIVPWRYNFNTVTFSYTSSFWTWDDWELQLDWMALRGINLPLAWVGYEKILIDVFLEAGFTQSEINSFLSGPAFQAWNRFGNIQGSWGGDLPSSWIDGQFELNKKIVARMVELGMTPVLPCFTGFVPEAISRVAPNASFVDGDAWNGFPRQYTNVTFLEPFDPLFAKLQQSFISKQQTAYGNVSSVYTLDQYNENDPFSGDLTYLKNVTSNTYASLRGADPNAVWMLQGWLFFSSKNFWTDARVESYLSGVSNESMIILDLFSESEPQWQRTNNYYGKPWVWCMLHDYGGNMGLYGQIENVTINPLEALANKSSSMVGMGLTMEGEEGNEVVYDLVLDQAWSAEPIKLERYFHDWVASRYSKSVPQLHQAWDILRRTVYNNQNLTKATAVTKSILELAPNTTGLERSGGHHPTIIAYDPQVLVDAWKLLFNAADESSMLWQDHAYTLDLTDVTRQVLANAFVPLYKTFINASNSSLPSHNTSVARDAGEKMLSLLDDLDTVLAASNNSHFSLAAWVSRAEAWASHNLTDSTYSVGKNMTSAQTAAFYRYNAINQVTLWGPTGQISDYASKQWAGLVGQYYRPRWQLFIDYTLNSTTTAGGVNPGLKSALLQFGENFDMKGVVQPAEINSLKDVIARVVSRWPDIFKGHRN